MLRIESNGQVLKQEIGDTYVQWLPIGMEKEVQVIAEKITASVNEAIIVSLAWQKVNLETEVWEPDAANQESFNLVAGDQNFTVLVSPGTQEINFSAAGNYTVGVRNPGKGSQDITIIVA